MINYEWYIKEQLKRHNPIIKCRKQQETTKSYHKKEYEIGLRTTEGEKRKMYQKKSHGWYKHKDFILLDLLCIFLAFIFAYYIRNHTYISITDNGVYRNAMIFVLFADLVVIILFEVYTGVLRRGYYREFIQVLE